MGPRLFNRGKEAMVTGLGILQPASMGPRLFNRGKVHYQRRTPAPTYHASMGPRLFNRGKTRVANRGEQ